MRPRFRMLKLHLEAQVHQRIELTHKMLPELVSWAADVILKYEARTRGRARDEDITGRRACHSVLGFGEHVHPQTTATGTNTTGRG